MVDVITTHKAGRGCRRKSAAPYFSKAIAFRLPPEQQQKFRIALRKRGLSQSTFLREAIEALVAQDGG